MDQMFRAISEGSGNSEGRSQISLGDDGDEPLNHLLPKLGSSRHWAHEGMMMSLSQ